MERNEMPELTVTSEIYGEYDYRTKLKASQEGNFISEFPFLLPKSKSKHRFDEDGDLDYERPHKAVIKIEHSSKTKIALVGLQVWRGAFLLGDLLIHLGLNGELSGKSLLELGAGTGFTSFIAALYAKKVICTDINLGGILDLIKVNAKYNKELIKAQFKVMPLDFTEMKWGHLLSEEVKNVDVVVAADVIYDDDVTAAFVSTVQKIMNINPSKQKVLYIVMEKRYVFTTEHLESVAPCYETFLALLDEVNRDSAHSSWSVDQLPLDFPKYFTYDRVKELVVWKITSKVPENSTN